MSSHTAQAATRGPVPGLFLLALFAAMMAALLGSRVGPAPSTKEVPREDHRERGRAYEAHVLAAEHLPRRVRAQGSTLRAHPRLLVPRKEVAATYFAAPGGFAGEVVLDTRPHAQAPATWKSAGRRGVRIPDALATRPDGHEVLYELKCPSPWLTFGEGNPWASKMQAAFASQALAFGLWGREKPNRQVVYGFCGLIPPWAEKSLRDIEMREGVTFIIEEMFYINGFRPAWRFVGAAQREILTEMTLGTLSELALDELAGPTYDAISD